VSITNATLAGDATWNASTQDGSAYCLDVSGAGHAVASHEAKLNLTNSFAILMRFKAKATNQTSKYLLSKLNSGGTDNNYSLLYEYAADSVEFYAGGYTGSNPRTSSGLTISDTNWHAIAYRYNGTEWAKWLDGSKTTISASISFSLATGGTNSLYIGSFSAAANRTSCCIDDISIYSNGNLPTDNEIATWQTSYTLPSSVAPVARWQFNEGSGATAADSGVPSASITASTSSIVEAAGTASIYAILNQTASATVNVILGLGGTATSGSDYTLSSNTISIASAATSGSISITAVQDATYEGDETVVVTISSVSGGGAAIGPASSSTIIIVDDDAASAGSGVTGLSGLSGLSAIF